MSKHALIFTSEPLFNGKRRLHAIAETDADRFEVHEDFQWIPCPNDVTNRDWLYDPEEDSWAEPARPKTEYNVARRVHYGEIGAQLDRIYHAYNAGSEDPMAEWAAEQEKIKAVFPKDNQDYADACNTEIARRCDAILVAEEAITGVYGKYIDMRQMALDLYDDIQSGAWVNPHA